MIGKYDWNVVLILLNNEIQQIYCDLRNISNWCHQHKPSVHWQGLWTYLFYIILWSIHFLPAYTLHLPLCIHSSRPIPFILSAWISFYCPISDFFSVQPYLQCANIVCFVLVVNNGCTQVYICIFCVCAQFAHTQLLSIQGFRPAWHIPAYSYLLLWLSWLSHVLKYTCNLHWMPRSDHVHKTIWFA